MNEINRNAMGVRGIDHASYNGPGLLGIFIVTCISVSMCGGGPSAISSGRINDRLDAIQKTCAEKKP